MPPTPSSPLPPSSRPGRSGPCQQHLPFWFPVHRLHWSCHSLSPIVPLPSVIRPPDQCRPRNPYNICLLHSPCPPTPLYLTHTTPPTLTHWWFSTWGAQHRHPTDGSLPLTHQPINLHPPIHNQTHSAHLPQRQTWGHMVSSFKFGNYITFVIWHVPMNQSRRPDPATVAGPHCAPT